MILTNEQLKKIYYGAYRFSETGDGYLQAYQYTERQMRYFEEASDFWFERCTASNAKTIEFRTKADRFSLEYKIIWAGSQDSVELSIDGLLTRIFCVKDLEEEGKLSFDMPSAKRTF